MQQRIYALSVTIFLVSIISSSLIAFGTPTFGDSSNKTYQALEYNVQTLEVERTFTVTESIQQQITQPVIIQTDAFDIAFVPETEIVFTIDNNGFEFSGNSTGFVYVQSHEIITISQNYTVEMKPNEEIIIDLNNTIYPIKTFIYQNIQVMPGELIDVNSATKAEINRPLLANNFSFQQIVSLVSANISEIVIFDDFTPPFIEILNNDLISTQPTFEIIGEVSEVSEVKVNNQLVQLDDALRFTFVVELVPGVTIVTIEARDEFGNESFLELEVQYVPASFPVSFGN